MTYFLDLTRFIYISVNVVKRLVSETIVDLSHLKCIRSESCAC